MRTAELLAGPILSMAVAMVLPADAPATAEAGQPQTAVQTPSGFQQDEQAIRQSVDAFVRAYNAADAKTLAAMFTADALLSDERGHVVQGRDAIEKTFAAIFRRSPKGRMENSLGSIRFVSSTEAIEEGVTTITHDPAAPPERNRYRVVHAKRDGKWLMASAADLPGEPWPGEEQIGQLEWLIGDWVDEGAGSLILVSYRWTDNRRFILSEYRVQVKGRAAVTGSQRIGWDPAQKSLRSWVFASEGGFAEGLWTKQEDAWVVKFTAVPSDGQTARATNTLTRINQDRMSWQSRDRHLGDVAVPDFGPIFVVRRPPQPK